MSFKKYKVGVTQNGRHAFFLKKNPTVTERFCFLPISIVVQTLPQW